MPPAAKSARFAFAASVLLIAAAAVSLVRAQQQAPAPPPAQREQEPPGYAIQRDVNLVVLHATVVNARGQFVPGLKQESFRVFEDKIEQKLSLFRQEDVAVSLGLVIDNSGSMRDKVAQVRTAALTFVKVSNPQDESFVVNFNDDFYLDTVHDFTSDVNELKDALDRIDSRGSTGLYDALIGSLDHLKKGHKDKKVLLVISDGLDNASRRSLEDAVREAQRSDAVIYAIGIFSDEDLKQSRSQMRKARGALTDLTTATGGLAFFPDTAAETEALCTQIAHDIRNQYTLAYSPTNIARDGKFRSVQVDLTPPKGMGKLSVRTRTGYFPRNAASGN
jgi:Ca-activated chloride channel family protein